MVKRKKKVKKLFIGVVSLAILGGAGYFGYKYFNTDVNKEVELPKEEVEKEVPKLKILDEDSNTRPYAVMINNNSAVWKFQSGLNDAYMVYELLVEGGITREMAIFKDVNVDKIQSIRSSRHYFLDYSLENDAIYVHWGWSPQAQSDIKRLGVPNVNGLTYENSYFFRDNSVTASYEHRGYTSTELIKNAVERLGYRNTTESSPLLSYSIESINIDKMDEKEEAIDIKAKFSSGYTANFKYNKDTGLYEKWQNSTEMIDYTSKEKITTKNIIIYKAGYSLMSGDEKGRLNMSNIGSGEGYYFTDGYVVPIKWSKTSRSAKTEYRLVNGEILKVNDGNTYIGIIPNGQSVTYTGNVDTENN